MATNAYPAYGTVLKRGSTPSGGVGQVMVTIGDVKSIDGPSTEVSTIDVTTHSSAASGNYREFVPSLIDPGKYDFEINFAPNDTTHQNLWTDLTNRTLRDFVLQTPANRSGSSANQYFSGYVIGYSHSFPTDDVMSANISIQVTGAITKNYG